MSCCKPKGGGGGRCFLCFTHNLETCLPPSPIHYNEQHAVTPGSVQSFFFLPVASLPAQVSITAIMAILHFILAKCHTQQVLQHTSWFISKSGQHCRVASSKVAKKSFSNFQPHRCTPSKWWDSVHTPRWTRRRGYFGSLCFQWDPYSMVKRLRQET